MNTVEFLDAVKRRHGLTSDYQLSKRMGWTTQRVSIYRAGRRELDDDACVQIAEQLGVPPPYVMACVAAARAKSASIKKHWLEAAKLLKTGTAAVIRVGNATAPASCSHCRSARSSSSSSSGASAADPGGRRLIDFGGW